MNVSRETQDRLVIYERLLRDWNTRINLVAPGSLADFGHRHIEDSLQVAALAEDVSGTWVDMGSGGGLPGIVLAVAKADTGMNFVLVESDQRKAVFLRTVVRETGLENTRILSRRIEDLPSLNAAYVSARALAPLGQLMRYVHQHLAPSGRAFLMKGRHWSSELDEARAEWRFDCISHASRTEPGAAVLEISGVSHGAA